MSATNTESFTNPRDNLPNVYSGVTEREIDFVSRFSRNWDALKEIIGISRAIRKEPGTKLISYTTSVALESGNVDAGEVIPYSKTSIVQAAQSDLTVEKYAKAVPIEDVNKYGAEIAIEKSDDAFLAELQNVVLTKFYTFLNTGTLTNNQTTFQMALSMAKGLVTNKWKAMRKTATAVVGFANVLDVYEYIGAANITVQNRFGFDYVKDFMGYATIFLMSDADIQRGRVVALPVENIDLYYVDPGDSQFAKLGLNYVVDGDTNLIGFHAQGNYSTAVGESFALMGMTLWAEYLDGIAIVDLVSASASIGSVSSSTAAYSAGSTGDTTVTISTTAVAGGKFYFKSQASSAPAAPTYLSQFDTTGWTEVKSGDHVASTNSHKYRIVEVNGSGQAIATGDGTVTAKT